MAGALLAEFPSALSRLRYDEREAVDFIFKTETGGFAMLSIGQLGAFIAVLMLSSAITREAHAVRYVKVVVLVDGKPILESSRGDRGDEDADEVWGYLKHMTFIPTEEFAATHAGAKTVNLESKAPVGQNGEIVIDMPYGGWAQTRRLKLIRVSRDDAGHE